MRGMLLVTAKRLPRKGKVGRESRDFLPLAFALKGVLRVNSSSEDAVWKRPL